MPFSHKIRNTTKSNDDCPPLNVWSIDHCDYDDKENFIYVNLAQNRESYTAY